MKRSIVCLFGIALLTVTSLTAFGQAVRLSDKPDQFMADVQKLMATGGPGAARTGAELQAVWSENRLTPQQQERVMTLSRKMNQKRLAPATFFASFYGSVVAAANAQPAADIDGLLTVAEKLFETADARTFGQSLQTTRLFLEKRLLYTSNYNKLYVHGGSFRFRFIGNDAPVSTSQAAEKTPAQQTADSLAAAKAAAERSRFDGWDEPQPGDSAQPRSLGVQFVPQRRALPTVSGAVITLTDVSLAMVANKDSAVLANTSGDLLLKEGVFVGKGGKFTWESVERPDIFVTFSEYALPIISPRLQADDVTLTAEGLTAKPVKGVFEYVLRKRAGPTNYPRFMSWQNDAKIPGLGADVDYRGGLALAGTQLVGASASGQPAVIVVKHNGKPAFKASSRRFDFKDSTITAQSAAFVGYIDADSITHPAVQFKFDKTQRVAWLNRPDRTEFARVPLADSYHKFYILPEVTRWDLPRRKVDFYQVGAKREVPVRFESFDYFLPQRYSDISVDYGFHPLQIVANFVSTKKQQTFTDDEITQSVKQVSPVALRGALNRMVLEGYIDRDAAGLMRLSRKGVLYVLANVQKKDYDNFQVQSTFASNDSTKNATINLDDKLLTIRGVSGFTISDSLKVFGFPSDKTLRIGKGRAFSLNGQLKAGNLRYAGQNLQFDYDKFSMNLNKIDSITFSSQKLAAQGKEGEVGGDIKYENPGTVFLAGADNKSGQMKGKKTTQRLVMPQGMTVYFDQPVRGDLIYNKKVYFKIPAIDNDSIGQGDISFLGTFYSDGIFPPFKAELKTMPDNTLGFVHKAPATGYPVYSSKPGGPTVKLTTELTMDKNGLRAEGVLNHLTTTLNTGGMLFMTDSLLASGANGEVKEGLVGKTYFPQVKLNNYSLKWWPKADSMVITTQKNNFVFYNATTNLEGEVVLRSTGLFGSGTLRRKDSEAISKRIKFNKDGFLANDAQFKILSDKENARPILLGNGVDVDFNQTKGLVGLAINNTSELVGDSVAASLEFPSAAYKTNINRAQWNVNARTIAMKGDVKTSTFTATSEEQEGLTFNGSAALYDVEKMMLNISGVPYVTAADARIFPDKGIVTVRRNGEMMALKNARLELDTVSLFHKLKNGNIQVLSRTRFAGDATYLYPTMKGDTAAIKMGSFELKEAPAVAANSPSPEKQEKGGGDEVRKPTRKTNRTPKNTNAGKTYFTVARAEVEETDNLQLAPRILYKGLITMEAPRQDLALDGAIKPALKKRRDLEGNWIPFKEKIGERLEIKVDKTLKNEGGQQLVAGIHFRLGGGSNSASGLYPTFLSAKEDSRDDDLFTATGVMRYDEKDKLYRITSSTATESIAELDSASDDVENAFTFNDPRGLMTYKGKLNLLNARPNEYLLAAGSARINIDSALYRFNTLLAFTFPMPEPITTAIASKLITANQEERNDEAADDDLNRLSDKLLPLIGQQAVDAYRTKAQNAHVPLSQASPKLNAALVLANANLRWSDKFNAFYSVGRLGVSNIMTADINAQMDGFIEIRKMPNGDEASIYLEASEDEWVFYDYKPGNGPGSVGQLAIVTSSQDINDRLLAGSKNSGKAALELVSATTDEKELFVDRYLDQYKTRPKAAPKPKTQPKAPTPAAQPTVAASSDPFDETVEPAEPKAAEPAPKAAKGAKTKPQKAKPGQLPAAADKPAPKVAKEEPKPKEKKKDKEDEREGF
ncbi:hypothetical protein [Spirosoma montaniterrae]|uniref:Organic solvent tolerance protein OstA n=1 Tax=Spirosoma montaniterrae TaxID=1178516 RepID=A0A1P9X1E6_9BACT|nr:hypothetical protein [Spirosoma montaniterrae]AQG81423.1 hypothetical protein AWR27_20135 [Spirosoma montaniterrae]